VELVALVSGRALVEERIGLVAVVEPFVFAGRRLVFELGLDLVECFS
jgi:hypothetical protein